MSCRCIQLFLIGAVVAVLVQPLRLALAQDTSNCVALLQHGIYDTFRQTSGNVSSAQYKFDLCQAYSKLQSDKAGGSVSAHYALIGGEASYSSDQLQQIGESMCTTTASSNFSQANLDIMQQVVDQAAVDAYKQCVILNSAGLKTNTTIRESDDGQMTLDMYYVAPIGGVPNVTIAKIDISPAGAFTCDGPLWDMQGTEKVMDTHSYGMSCARAIKTTPDDASNILAPTSTVAVITNVGSVTRSFVPILASPPPPKFDLPVGTIIAYSGTEAQAEAQTANGWWVCDGRTVTDPHSTQFKGKSTPNLVNRFLRAANQAGGVGGADSFVIPSQDIDSHTTGQFGPPSFNSDPFTHMQGSHPWNTDVAIYSKGTWQGLAVPTVPSFYSVIYLIRVR